MIILIPIITLVAILIWWLIIHKKFIKEIKNINEELRLLHPDTQKRTRASVQQIFEFICEEEGIPLHFVSEIIISKNGIESAGVYSYKANYNEEWIRPVEIKIKKGESEVFTLAHELGHHFCLKHHNDGSEEAADRYIKTLFEEFVPPDYQKILEIPISVYSGIK